MEHEPKSLLSATTNTRDLGGYPALSNQTTVKNRIWRSDAPIIWNPSDLRLLINQDIKTIIDLRTNQETEKHPCAYANEQEIQYHHFPIEAGSVPPSTLAEVPASYLQIASQKETAAALRVIAEAETGVLFCCAAGKDRTGVLSAILLFSCGVNHPSIVYDYALSREYNKERLEKYLSEHPLVERQVVLANEASMEKFLNLFFARYETVENYYLAVGLTSAHLKRIQKKLLDSGAFDQGKKI